jgi:DNA-binding transcriptional LysR family regulator
MIDKLEYLLALAQAKHFGRAAEACSVSQPSLSLGVKQLEEALGVMLVKRGSRFIGLTPEGERTLEWARRIVGDARAMRQDIKVLRHSLTGRLRIAVIPAALPMVAMVTRPLHLRHPEVEFTILSQPSTDIVSMLDNLEIDGAITYLDIEPLTRVTAIPIYRERYQLLIAADSQFGLQKSVSWQTVAKLPLCLLTSDTQNRRLIEALLLGASGVPRISLESNSMTVLFSHVRTGSWASVMPEKVVQAMGMTKEFQVIPIVNPEIVHTIGLVIPVRDPATSLVTALAAEARRTGELMMQLDNRDFLLSDQKSLEPAAQRSQVKI